MDIDLETALAEFIARREGMNDLDAQDFAWEILDFIESFQKDS